MKTKFKKKKLINVNDNISVENVDLSEIKLWKENPRKNENSAKDLAKLLKKHGQKTPIVVWKKNNVIYKGNTTYKAAKILGWKKIWVAYPDFKDEADAISYALSDNKSSEWSEWDDNILSKLLTEKFDGNKTKEISGITGFSEKDLAGLFASGSVDLPGKLPDIDLEGASTEIVDKIDYLVIQFPSNEAMKKFRSHFDSDEKHPRVVTYESLMKGIQLIGNKTKPKEKIKKKIKFKKRK